MKAQTSVQKQKFTFPKIKLAQAVGRSYSFPFLVDHYTMASAATSSSARLKAKSNKRKRPAPSTSSPIEIAKAIPVRGRLSGEDLPWQPVKASSFPGMDEGGGMMMLEELDNVDVAWDEDELGRKVARFVVSLLLV